LVLANPKAIENPFCLRYPHWALLPMVVLATAATVIASQAVITGAYSVTQQAVQAIQSMWKSAGMDVTIQGFEQSAFIANAVTGKYTAQIWRQFGAQDPDGNYVWFAGANATGALTLNMARNVDPKIDTALNAQRATPDENARKEAWATIQQQQTADLPYLWLSHVRWALAASNSVRGLDGGTLPDGSPSMGFNQGVIRVTQMWMDN